MNDNNNEASPADIFCAGIVAKCRAANRPAIYEVLVTQVLRPYLHTLDNAEEHSSSDYADALAGLAATMVTTFIGHVIPHDQRDAATDVAQTFLDALSASVSADLAASYTQKPKPQVIMAVDAFKKKNKLDG